jgi:hypothetical protein
MRSPKAFSGFCCPDVFFYLFKFIKLHTEKVYLVYADFFRQPITILNSPQFILPLPQHRSKLTLQGWQCKFIKVHTEEGYLVSADFSCPTHPEALNSSFILPLSPAQVKIDLSGVADPRHNYIFILSDTDYNG